VISSGSISCIARCFRDPLRYHRAPHARRRVACLRAAVCRVHAGRRYLSDHRRRQSCTAARALGMADLRRHSRPYRGRHRCRLAGDNDPPAHAVVLSIDEKSQIQARRPHPARTADQAGTLPSHDARLQAARHHHPVRRPQRTRAIAHQFCANRLLIAASPAGESAVLATRSSIVIVIPPCSLVSRLIRKRGVSDRLRLRTRRRPPGRPPARQTRRSLRPLEPTAAPLRRSALLLWSALRCLA
jgi:hypothetical protein